MNEPSPPLARPVTKPPPPVARPVEQTIVPARVVPLARAIPHVDGTNNLVVKRTTEPFAVASAVCGLTAIIPVLSQLLGLSLGIMSMVRLRRAKRNGIYLAGTGWAITGIVTSGLALIGWIGFAATMAYLGSTLLESSTALNSLLRPPA